MFSARKKNPSDIITNDYANGRLKMIDVQSFNKSLKATWIKKYLDEENQGKWKYFFDIELERFGGTIVLTSNLRKIPLRISRLRKTL